MPEEFKLGSHCLGLAQAHFEEKFADVKPGALQLAMIDIGMEGFRIGMQGKVSLYKALKAAKLELQECEYAEPNQTMILINSALAKAEGES